MTTSAERIRAWNGPAILSFGFRPFFLAGAIWAALAMVLWVAMLAGRDVLPTAFDPVSWHAHEMLFGYPGARPAGELQPLDNIVAGWRSEGARMAVDGVEIEGSYDQARGVFKASADENGILVLQYDFKLQESLQPLQTGLSLSLPLSWDSLEWQLAGRVDPFPEDHVARTAGRASAHPPHQASTTAEAPQWPWIHDGDRRGTNDFRATKLCIARARIFGQDGRGLALRADGKQHVRTHLDRDCVRLFVFDYSGEGSESFLESFAVPHLLDKGATLAGTVRINYSAAG